MERVNNIEDESNAIQVYIGIALQDMSPNSETLQVHISTLTPFNDGAIEPQSDMLKVGDESSGEHVNVEATNAIEATYFSLVSNRAYCPDVKKGEQVLVFKFRDSQNYLFYPLGRDDYLRRTERVTFRASNNLSTPQGLSDNNSYTLELDTKYKGHILLKTSKTSNEPYQYQIKIDTQASTIQICDDDNNQILLDSKVPRIQLINKEGAAVNVESKNVSILAPEDIILKAERQILFNSPVITTGNTGKYGACVINSRNMTINASGSMVIKSPCIGLDGSVVANSMISDHVKSGGFSTGAGSVLSISNSSSSSNNRWSIPVPKNYSATQTNTISSPVKKILPDIPIPSLPPIPTQLPLQYVGVITDLFFGRGSDPGNTPRGAGPDSGNRFCAAWGYDDGSSGVMKAIEHLCDAIDKLAEQVGADVSGETSAAKSEATASKMNLNKGE